MSNTNNNLSLVTTRLFSSDVSLLKRLAKSNGSKWQIELRQLVRRALKGEKREIVILKD